MGYTMDKSKINEGKGKYSFMIETIFKKFITK